jgi:uncharacterized protein YkwD
MWSKLRAVWLLAALAFVPVPAFGQDAPREPKNRPDLGQACDQIVAATNRFREHEGRARLKVNDELSKAAQSFAEYMADNDKYGHTADGREPADRVAQAGYDYCIVLENIAYTENPDGFTTDDLAKQLVESWQQSPPHRKNMLDPDVSDFGVGVAHSAKSGRFYAVQDYGRPKSDQTTFKIANKTDSQVKYAIDGKNFTAEPGYTMTHQSCRTPELRFEWPEGTEADAAAKGTLHPTAGAEYVVRKSESGTFTVERR